jgi:hypothetical protein
VKKNTLDILFSILAVILAALLRFTQLGTAPLSNLEASQALQALNVFAGHSGMISGAPIYTGLAGIFFALFGSSDLAARFLPALVGVLFILLPLFYRERLSRATTIILMYFLALDPFLIYLSREAGSGMIAIAGVVCFFITLEKRKSIWMGFLGTLAILSGSFVFPGVAAIGGAAAWMRGQVFANDDQAKDDKADRIAWGKVFLTATITLLSVGLFFIKYPWLINGFGAGISQTVQGWIIPAELLSQGILTRMMVGLVFLMPLTFILGGIGLIRGMLNKDRFSGFLARWVLIASVIVLIYPQHRVTDLAWVSIPLCIGAAVEIQKWVYQPESHQAICYIYAAACSLLIIFCSLKIANLLVYEPGTADFQLAVAGIALTLLMLVVSAFLIGWGWSWKVSFFGLGIGLVVVLSIFSMSMSRRAAGLGGAAEANILAPDSMPLESKLLITTINDISRQNKGVPGNLGVSLLRIDDKALRWNLRDTREVRSVEALAPDETPDLLITNANEGLQLPASYRGQDFVRSATVPWTLLTGKEWFRWVIFGNAPLQKDFIILWARNDLFPNGGNSTP